MESNPNCTEHIEAAEIEESTFTPITRIAEPNNHKEKYLSGIQLKLSIISTTIGAGVLFLHSAFVTGGLLAFLAAVLLSAVSIFSVTECVYVRYRKTVREDDLYDEHPYPIKMTYLSLISTNYKFIQGLLTVLLIIKSGIAITVYQTLVWTWLYNIIHVFNENILGLSSRLERVLQIVFSVVLLCMFCKYSIQKEPGKSRIMQKLSAISLTLLVVLLVIIICIQPIDHSKPIFSDFLLGRSPSVLNFIKAVAIAYFGLNPHHHIPVYMSKTEVKSKRKMVVPLSVGISVVYLITGTIGAEGYFLAYKNNFKNSDNDIFVLISDILQNRSYYQAAEFLIVIFKIAISAILTNAFIWQCYTYKALVIDIYEKLKEYTTVRRHYLYNKLRRLSDNIYIIRIRYKTQKIFNIVTEWIRKCKTSSESTEERICRYIIGLYIFISTTLIISLEISLQSIIQFSGALISSFISLLMPALLLLWNRHITTEGKKRWFDYFSIGFMGIGCAALVSVGSLTTIQQMISENSTYFNSTYTETAENTTQI